MSKKDVRKSIKQGRESVFKVASQARNVGLFFTNPIGFLSRLARQSVFNWMDNDTPDRRSEEKSKTESSSSRKENRFGFRERSDSPHEGSDFNSAAPDVFFDAPADVSDREVKGIRDVYTLGELIEEREKDKLYVGIKKKEQQDEEQCFLIKQYTLASGNTSKANISSESISQLQEFIENSEKALDYRILLPCDRTRISETSRFFYLVFDVSKVVEIDKFKDGQFKSLDENRNQLEPVQVYDFIKNVLQTLDILHDNSFLGRSISHRNLSLKATFYGSDDQVYISDLGPWETSRKRRGRGKEILFDIAKLSPNFGGKKEDLKALGEMSFALLLPEYERSIRQEEFGKFIDDLANEKFDSARTAFRELRKRVPEEISLYQVSKSDVRDDSKLDRHDSGAKEKNPRGKKYLIVLLPIRGLKFYASTEHIEFRTVYHTLLSAGYLLSM